MKEQNKRYQQNVDGPFYVEDGNCLACGAPESAAPDLIDHDQNESIGYHCYFKKQPSNAKELEQAIKALWVCCCDAIKYSGDDPKISEGLVELYMKIPKKIGLEQHSFNISSVTLFV